MKTVDGHVTILAARLLDSWREYRGGGRVSNPVEIMRLLMMIILGLSAVLAESRGAVAVRRTRALPPADSQPPPNPEWVAWVEGVRVAPDGELTERIQDTLTEFRLSRRQYDKALKDRRQKGNRAEGEMPYELIEPELSSLRSAKRRLLALIYEAQDRGSCDLDSTIKLYIKQPDAGVDRDVCQMLCALFWKNTSEHAWLKTFLHDDDRPVVVAACIRALSAHATRKDHRANVARLRDLYENHDLDSTERSALFSAMSDESQSVLDLEEYEALSTLEEKVNRALELVLRGYNPLSRRDPRPLHAGTMSGSARRGLLLIGDLSRDYPALTVRVLTESKFEGRFGDLESMHLSGKSRFSTPERYQQIMDAARLYASRALHPRARSIFEEERAASKR